MTMIDSHTHIWKPEDVEGLEAIREAIGAERVGVASVADERSINDNPVLFVAKAMYPSRFYTLLGLDHAEHFSGGAISTPSLAEQIDRMIEVGADGLKLIETKPTHRRMVDIPIDSEHYEPMFERVERAGLPILWHVADPEEFWDPELCPSWAKEAGWGYDESFVPKEQLYTEVENVVTRHPGLKVTFAHFYFLSADLPRAAAFLDRFANTHFDLAPGVEMLYSMSRDPAEAREFFIKHADRIVFGTDNMGDQPIGQARARTQMVKRWLETEDEFGVDPEADALLGQSDEVIRGMNLPGDVLARIYSGNFQRVVGSEPKPQDNKLALEESRRMAAEVERLGGSTEVIRGCIRRLEAMA